MNKDQIIKKALELGDLIATSTEWKEVNQARDRVKQDAQAWDLLLGFQETRGELLEKMRQEGAISSAEEKELQAAEQKLKDNPLIAELMKTQETFDNLMRAVYFGLNQGISGGASSCEGGCGGCGGGCQ